MLVAQEKIESFSTGVQWVNTVEELSQIHDPACAAAIFQRPIDTRLQSWIDRLDPEYLPDARVIIRPKEIRETVNRICERSGTPDCPERQMLVDDVVKLASVFAELMSAPYLRLRFDITKTDACRKFHMDYLTSRLICTYRGSGTQYGNATDGLDPQIVHSVPTGAPLVMRGQHWPNNPDTHLRHRSPPIEGTGQTRLVLVLDSINDMNEEVY
ncbi:MAG: DUF1826 domain-containing protein [Proteobacteria bacterium]|nr:DUF1826 domain-containing protein [Pseudomonadota bacterium]